ncbi:MAG: DUF192 domain-containing protein [Candidatus Riflebacteria bacterium]|nr:DUF192 domain-containing protein [Candidatus Riflebacteria bacterium]
MFTESKISNSLKWFMLLTVFISLLTVTCCFSQQNTTEETTSREKMYYEGKLASHTLKFMLARTDEEKRRGLMFVKSLEENEGMLFVYEKPQPMVFWMKNTFIPLDLILFSEDLSIIEIIPDMVPGNGKSDAELPRYFSRNMAQYALEMAAGTAKNWSLKPGDHLDVPLTILFTNEQ